MSKGPLRRVLVVSPHFPPVNAPDMQRVRMSLPYFEEFGWAPHVLAVSPSGHEVVEPLLNETLPANVPIERVPSLSPAVARRFGFGNVALRALPYLQSTGSRLLREGTIDLVYFSTTMFLSMPLARVWKRRFGVPYVLDIQDPWLSDYYETHPDVPPPPKYSAARRLHAVLEPWTMRTADGIIAVSPDYVATLQKRYPWLRNAPCLTLPFGASAADFDVLARHPQTNVHFQRGDGRLHGVSTGRGGDDLATAVDILCRALGENLALDRQTFSRIDLHFVGTDYATDGRARQTIAPRARAAGVGDAFHEDPARAPYFSALQLLKDADFLLVLGSDDAAYTPSKIYPYVLAGRPILAVVHESSPVVNVLRQTNAGVVVTFPGNAADAARAAAASTLASAWRELLSPVQPPRTDWGKFEQYTAREMTRRQCALFDQVIDRRRQAAA